MEMEWNQLQDIRFPLAFAWCERTLKLQRRSSSKKIWEDDVLHHFPVDWRIVKNVKEELEDAWAQNDIWEYVFAWSVCTHW